MSEISDMVVEMVREKHLVAIQSDFCKEWKSKHGNCKGCDSELGCGKVTSLLLHQLTSTMYEPKSYDDFKKKLDTEQDMFMAIMKAETIEELNKLRP